MRQKVSLRDFLPLSAALASLYFLAIPHSGALKAPGLF